MADDLSALDLDAESITRLGAAQISTVRQLLEATATPRQVEQLAARLGVRAALVRAWGDHAHLLDIPEVGPQVARLLIVCGIASPGALRHWHERDLYAKLQDMNRRERLLAEVPSQRVLGVWIRDAAILTRSAQRRGEMPPPLTPAHGATPPA